jgi:TPR repeat protein
MISGSANGQNASGILLKTRIGIGKDVIEAAKYNYVLCLQNGTGVEQQVIEAARYYKMRADQGGRRRNVVMGCGLQNGTGVEQNVIEAAKYYKMSADQDTPPGKIATAFVCRMAQVLNRI